MDGRQSEQGDLESRHRALIERDRWVGLEAEGEAARASNARLRADLAVARKRLKRKNARIELLAARVAELESGTEQEPSSTVRRAVSRFSRRTG